MENLKILNSKEKKQIIERIKKHFGIKELDLDYAFFRNNENKIFLLNKDVKKVDFDKLRVNSLGVYFGAFDNGFRLSIEGTQLIGNNAEDNVITLEDDTKWLEGNDINAEGEDGLKIVKCGNDFLGTGQLKNGTLINYISKERRIKWELQKALVLSELGRGREFRQETKTQVERVSRVAVDNVEARVVIVPRHSFYSVPVFFDDSGSLLHYLSSGSQQ